VFAFSFSFCILRTLAYLRPHALQSVFGPNGPLRHSGVSVAKHSKHLRSALAFFFLFFFTSYAVNSGSFPWNFTSAVPPIGSRENEEPMLGGVVVVRMGLATDDVDADEREETAKGFNEEEEEAEEEEEEDSGLETENPLTTDWRVSDVSEGVGVEIRFWESRRNLEGSERDAGLTK